MSYQYDLVVVGGGPGGLEAAQQAAAAGKRVLIMERTGWGGLSFRKKVLLVLSVVLSALVVAWIILALAGYYSGRGKGEIEKTFEEQIRKLIGQQ